MDFGDIKEAFEPIFNMLDHNCLNDIQGLENPTSENIAKWIWQKIKLNILNLSGIRVSETCTSGCIYKG